ncbi:MAG: alpha-mannosidase [Ignavibacteriaceae bacterium]|nr:alpha-mannosidase [Ignavibacteriaceae bacterium]
MKFIISVDDYGYLFVNGENKGYFPWDGEFELTKDAKPGTKYVLVIKAINTGGPLRLIRAKLDFASELPIQKLVRNFILGIQVGQKLLSFDTYQTNSRVKVDPGIDLSKMDREEKKKLYDLLQNTVTTVDVDAFALGDTVTFIKSLNEVKHTLKPIEEFAKRFTLYFTSNAHIDAAWLWRKKETVEVCKRTFSSVLNMFKARPDFTYTQSAAAYYKWMQEDYPELFSEIKNYIKQGRWEVVGGLWIEPDCNIPSGDSWSRQLLYAQNYFKINFGEKVSLGWNPDSFGYNWNMPQMYSKGNIDAFITQKIGWNDTNVFPYRVFWWQSPNGSKILTYFPFDYVNEISNPLQLIDWMRQFEANTGFTKQMILFGVGDHGGGPSLEMMARIDRLREVDIFPNIEYGTAKNYINWLRSEDLSNIPTWNDELYLEYHRGTLTTQSNTKQWNRNLEVLLTNTEKYSSIANLFGYSYPKNNLKDAWSGVLFNQFHDILPGSSIREVYIDSDKDYKLSERVAKFELDKALENISSRINTKNIDWKPLIVFNPLSWERSDIVRVVLPDGDKNLYSVADESGIVLQSLLRKKDDLSRELIFKADNIPPLGYKTYQLLIGDAINHSTVLESSKVAESISYAQAASIENEFFKVSIDVDSGWVKSIYDKRFNRELLAGYGNRLQLLEDLPKQYDAWNIGLTGLHFPSKFRKAELLENNSIRSIIRVYHDYLKPGVLKNYPTEDFPSSFFTQDVILYKGIDRVEFKTNIEWWEDKTLLKVAFPVSVFDTVAAYEIPFGTIKRSTTLKAQWDKGKWEVSGHKWADLSDNDFGISLLNKAKHGHDIKGNVIRLSLLRSPKWPDPTADRGDHSIEYALYPHSGNLEKSMTIRKGYEYNYPLIAVFTDNHNGNLRTNDTFVSVSSENIILTSFKKAENSEDEYVLNFYEAKGNKTTAAIKFITEISSASNTNF